MGITALELLASKIRQWHLTYFYLDRFNSHLCMLHGVQLHCVSREHRGELMAGIAQRPSNMNFIL